MEKGPGRIQINAGKYKGTVLKVPDAVVRPTPLMVRQALFNSLQHFLPQGSFLDLFAGTGAMGLEALSRGAISCTLVEAGRPELMALRQSLAKMGLSNCNEAELLPIDVTKAVDLLIKQKRQFNYIFIDPPYELWDKNSPVWLSLLSQLLTTDGLVICQRDKQQQQPLIPGLPLYETRFYGRSALDFYHHPQEENNE